MKINFNKLAIVFIGFLLCLGGCSCSTGTVKKHPEHEGVDPKLQPYVKEYKELAKIQGITFKNDVTIGFKKLNSGSVVGLTTFNRLWREIGIDPEYFEASTNTRRVALLFHELGHSYCTRGHDFTDKDGNGIDYPRDLSSLLEQAFAWRKRGGQKPGRYDDACPHSIMYPFVLEDDCMRAHYSDYVVELFTRCEAW